jgi:hypothetical protein
MLALMFVALAVLAAGGCTVRLISDYDETIDRSASELQKENGQFPDARWRPTKAMR